MPSRADYTSYRLYDISLDGSRQIAELISRAKADRMIRANSITEAVDWDGKATCFLRMEKPKVVRLYPVYAPVTISLEDAEAERSNAAFSKPEVMALAGRTFRHGRSRTARMTEYQREQRRDKCGKRLRPEDVVERATNKQDAWAKLGPALKELIREVPSF